MSYVQNQNSKMSSKTFNFLVSKSVSIHLLKRKRKNSEEASPDRDLLPESNCNFKLKRNKCRNANTKRRTKINLENSPPEKRRAPHNTSSFLIENFRQTEQETLSTSPYSPLSSDELEEICITGGSMKGKLTSNLSDLLLSDEFFLSSWNAVQQDRDQISLYSTDFSLADG